MTDQYELVYLDDATGIRARETLPKSGNVAAVPDPRPITQIDLKPWSSSGLVAIRDILSDIPGIQFTYLDQNDVVRHPLVQRIISAFEKANLQEGVRNGGGK